MGVDKQYLIQNQSPVCWRRYNNFMACLGNKGCVEKSKTKDSSPIFLAPKLGLMSGESSARKVFSRALRQIWSQSRRFLKRKNPSQKTMTMMMMTTMRMTSKLVPELIEFVAAH